MSRVTLGVPDGLTPFEVARRVAEVTGVLQPGPS